MQNSIYMELAIKEAYKGISAKHGGPFGAVIVKNNKIISKAHNEVLKNNDPTAHAEMLAIRKASLKLGTYNLEGCILYTTAEPCIMCQGAILWSRISTVYYGCTLSDTNALGFDDQNFESFSFDEISLQIMQDECKKLFACYNQIIDKIIY